MSAFWRSAPGCLAPAPAEPALQLLSLPGLLLLCLGAKWARAMVEELGLATRSGFNGVS